MIAPELRIALEMAAGVDRLVVACDYDGTLAPLVDDPSMAEPDRGALEALMGLGAMEGVTAIIISGRSPDVLAGLTGAPPDVTLIGDHGANHHLEGPTTADQGLASLVTAMQRVHRAYPGTRVEAKPHGAALHYRNAEDRDGAARSALETARHFEGRIIEGKDVVEVVLGEGDKGTAIDAVRRVTDADCVVFFGDDTTDEDVFATLGTSDVGVKVGDGPTRAGHRVTDPIEVGGALALILARRPS